VAEPTAVRLGAEWLPDVNAIFLRRIQMLFAGFGSARALRLTMQAAQPPEERQPGDFAERAMKDINRVGPSDARKKAIEDKMRQLR